MLLLLLLLLPWYTLQASAPSNKSALHIMQQKIIQKNSKINSCNLQVGENSERNKKPQIRRVVHGARCVSPYRIANKHTVLVTSSQQIFVVKNTGQYFCAKHFSFFFSNYDIVKYVKHLRLIQYYVDVLNLRVHLICSHASTWAKGEVNRQPIWNIGHQNRSHFVYIVIWCLTASLHAQRYFVYASPAVHVYRRTHTPTSKKVKVKRWRFDVWALSHWKRLNGHLRIRTTRLDFTNDKYDENPQINSEHVNNEMLYHYGLTGAAADDQRWRWQCCWWNTYES